RVFYSLSLHDALPIWPAAISAAFATPRPSGSRRPSLPRYRESGRTRHGARNRGSRGTDLAVARGKWRGDGRQAETGHQAHRASRSEEHTSELQSLAYL